MIGFPSGNPVGAASLCRSAQAGIGMSAYLSDGNWFVERATKPFSIAHVAICVREVNSNLDRILLTCAAAVRPLTTSASAISRAVKV